MIPRASVVDVSPFTQTAQRPFRQSMGAIILHIWGLHIRAFGSLFEPNIPYYLNNQVITLNNKLKKLFPTVAKLDKHEIMSFRSYKLLCPIARALDHVGDRWTLLILRDLHAGPARYSDLLSGLNGIASNLLTTRLNQLIESGLVLRQEARFGVAVYELTPFGRRSNKLLYELMKLGTAFPQQEELKTPGNLRFIAVTLKSILEDVLPPDVMFRAGLHVDGEFFLILCENDVCDIRHGEGMDEPVCIKTSYLPLMEVFEGRLEFDAFVSSHLVIEALGEEQKQQVVAMLKSAIDLNTQGFDSLPI